MRQYNVKSGSQRMRNAGSQLKIRQDEVVSFLKKHSEKEARGRPWISAYCFHSHYKQKCLVETPLPLGPIRYNSFPYAEPK